MRFYKLDQATLEKELNTDFSTGLTDELVSERSKECSNAGISIGFTANKISFEFIRTTILVMLGASVYVLLSVFNKDISWLYFFFGIISVYFFTVLGVYFYIKVINKKVVESNKNGMYFSTVLRNGKRLKLKCSELLYGDIIFLKKGDYIPADAYVLESESLIVDETGITTNTVVEKHVGIIAEENVLPSAIFNTLFCGGFVVGGKAKAVITDVGSRTYFAKTNPSDKVENKHASRITDYSRLIMLFLLIVVSVSTVISALIVKNYFEAIALVLIFASLFFSDLLTKYLMVVFTKMFNSFSNKCVFIKDLSVFSKINSSNTLLIEQNVILDGPATATAFYRDDTLHKISELDKTNFDVFVYALLSCDGKLKTSVDFSIQKLLKKIGVDFELIDSLSPVISHYSDIKNNLEICGRVYDDNNLLIAKGNYSDILKMCSQNFEDFPENIRDSLYSGSTEIIGVAVKSAEIIPSDLSEVKNGFRLVGLIAFDKNVSGSSKEKLKYLENSGYVNQLIFNGNKKSAEIIAREIGYNCVSFTELDDNTLSSSNIVYDCKSYADVVEKTVSHNAKVICFSSGTDNNKVLNIESSEAPALKQKKADIVCNMEFSEIFNILSAVSDAFCKLKHLFLDLILFFALLIIAFPLFALLNNSFIVSPMGLVTAIFAIIIPGALFNINTVRTKNNNCKLFISKPFDKNDIILTIITTLTFLIVFCLFGIFMKSDISAIFLLTFAGYFPNINIDKANKSKISDLFCYIPAILILILFLTPVSTLFGVENLSFFIGVTALIIGVGIRFLQNVCHIFLDK